MYIYKKGICKKGLGKKEMSVGKVYRKDACIQKICM